MHIDVTPQPTGFGAAIRGVDLSQPLSAEIGAEIRQAWFDHQVLAFPEQRLEHEDLERFVGYFGQFGDDPYIEAMPDHPHILELRREPDEQAVVFGASWHSDWSFLPAPPAATILHAKVVPPVGGDTLFANAYAAYEGLSDDLKQRIEGLTGIHSAAMPYGDQGLFAKEQEHRTMKILPSVEARKTQRHPLVRRHPETGKLALFVNQVYTIAIEGNGLDEGSAAALLRELCAASTAEAYVYRHHWQANMLVIWDNRCVQHSAQGGYDGHRRVMHRLTVAGDAPLAA